MRQLLLLSVLLLGVTWAVAQDAPATGQTGSQQAAASQTSVVGCLSSSAGKYMLTDKHGNTIQLTGDTAKLADHVGHEVKITGVASSDSAAPSSTGASASAPQSIEVTSMKHISKTCKSGGMAH